MRSTANVQIHQNSFGVLSGDAERDPAAVSDSGPDTQHDTQ